MDFLLVLIRATRLEGEAADQVAGAQRKIEKEANLKAFNEEVAKEQAARKQMKADKKAKAEAEAAKRPAKTVAEAAAAPVAAEAVAAPEPAAEAVAAPEPVAAAEAPAGGEITPKTIKALRDLTGAGMMNCKKALIEADGDQEIAAENLRKKGLSTADKKASRIASEGKIAFTSIGNKAVMVEVNCETDFVGKDASFLAYCEKVASAAINVEDDNVESLLAQEVDGETLEVGRQAMVSKIGENIQVRRMASRGSDGSTVGCYVHMNRIGVLVELEGGDEKLAADIAMHVAAMNPPYATAEEVPGDVLDNERRILSDQALDSGKPPEIVEKMVEGRIRKYLEEICLVSQVYVRDGDKTVGKLLEDAGAKMIGFTRITVGEGMEKKEDDFAAEVAAMAAGQ
jgi:elongation factor Ts